MSYIGVKINGLIQKMAGMPLMDVAFSNRSTNGVQNKIITAKKDEIEGRLDDVETDLSELTNKTIIESPADRQSETIANATDTKVATITISEPGTYLFEGTVSFISNTTGRRAIYITKTNSFEFQSAVTAIPVPNTNTILSTSRMFNVSAGETVNLFAYQTSGNDLLVYKSFYCIKLN